MRYDAYMTHTTTPLTITIYFAPSFTGDLLIRTDDLGGLSSYSLAGMSHKLKMCAADAGVRLAQDVQFRSDEDLAIFREWYRQQ